MSFTWEERDFGFERSIRLEPTPTRKDGHPIYGVVYKPKDYDWWSDKSHITVRWHVQSNSAELPMAQLHMIRGEVYAKTEEAAIELAKIYVGYAVDAMTFLLMLELKRHPLKDL